MRNWIIALLAVSSIFLAYNNYALLQIQKQSIIQFASLSTENKRIEKMLENSKLNLIVSGTATPVPAAVSSRLRDLQAELGVEKDKLGMQIEQRKQLLATLNDSVQTQRRRLDDLIQQRHDTLESINQQMSIERSNRLQIENSGHQAQFTHTAEQTTNVQALNQQIQTLEDQMKVEQAEIKQWKQSIDYERKEKIASINANISTQKQNIVQLNKQKQIAKENDSLQGKQIQNQVNFEKTKTQQNELQLKSQADFISADIKQLNQQRNSLKPQAVPNSRLEELDQLIKVSQSIIRNLELALKVH